MTYKHLLILLILSVSSSLAQAESKPKYRFEIIVFEYTNKQNSATEAWPDNPGYPDYANAIFSISGSKKYTASRQNPDINFQLLQPSQFILKKEANIIKRSSSRKLLLHTAWIQSMQSKRRAYPVSLKIGKSYNNQGNADRNNQFGDMGKTTSLAPTSLRQIEGTIKISISRYLHVWTDLLYSAPNDYAGMDSDNLSSLKSYRHVDHRKMRSKELHYIDNPNFGILIYALPVK